MAKGGKQNVASTRIVLAAAEALGNRASNDDKCKWLRENRSEFTANEVIATEKAWGCRNQNK